MEILIFLFILFLIFIGIPLFKVGFKIYHAQKKAREAFSQFNKQQQQQAENFHEQQKKKQNRQRRKSMGEYVEFEDVSDSLQTSCQPQQEISKKSSSIKDEPLITDAEWEEIK